MKSELKKCPGCGKLFDPKKTHHSVCNDCRRERDRAKRAEARGIDAFFVDAVEDYDWTIEEVVAHIRANIEECVGAARDDMRAHKKVARQNAEAMDDLIADACSLILALRKEYIDGLQDKNGNGLVRQNSGGRLSKRAARHGSGKKDR